MYERLQRLIVAAIADGADLTTIEEQIIDPAPLDEEQTAALWLYADALHEQHGAPASAY